MAEKLLPCPFCGNPKPELVDDRTCFFVRCVECKPFFTVIYGESRRDIDHVEAEGDEEADDKTAALVASIDWDALRQSAVAAWNRRTPAPETHLRGCWLPIDQADKAITDVQEFSEVGMTIKTSDRYWVRDDDGRVYEAAWSEGKYGRDYWWDFEGESPVDPVEFMPHPLDPRWAATSAPEVSE